MRTRLKTGMDKIRHRKFARSFRIMLKIVGYYKNPEFD